MEKFRGKFGLINSRSNEFSGENAILWTIQHYFLTNGEDESEILNALSIMRQSPGIMNQSPHDFTGPEMYVSHDNLTSIMMFSLYNNLHYHKEIWTEIKRQHFRYNNVDEIQTFKQKLTNSRLLHPRDILFYGHLCGNPLWKLFAPLTLFFMLFSVKKKKGTVMKTDDDLLNFVKLEALKDTSWFWKQVWKYNMRKVQKEFGNYNNVFKIYFREADHPNNVDSTHI